jgi:hypothetical protein
MHSEQDMHVFLYGLFARFCTVDYGYRFVNRCLIHGTVRRSAAMKIEKGQLFKYAATQLTWAEYELIAQTVKANKEQVHEITRFPTIEPEATNISYLDYDYPGDNWTTKYYFELNYNLPITNDSSSAGQYNNPTKNVRQIHFSDGEPENR